MAGIGTGRFPCPHCSVVASTRHGFLRHLKARHGAHGADAEQVVAELVASFDPAAERAVFVTAGHQRSLTLLEQTDAAAETLKVFMTALGTVPVHLRPVDAGLTVMSLDATRCESMISVGAVSGGGLLRRLPPEPVQVERMVAEYVAKRDSLARASPEERFALRIVSAAVSDGLRVAGTPWWFVAHEWRLPISNGSIGKIDLLAFEPERRRLVVIECKASAADARKADRNGWDAARQADEYAAAIWSGRAELYPFFERLVAAQAALYGGAIIDVTLDATAAPTTAVWWPEPDGDHRPPWPAWNAAELMVESDSERRAYYRRHQSWWRETVRAARPGPHPTRPGRLVGSVFDRSVVAADRSVNFIDEAAYRHAERRAREVPAEGGTLDEERLFTNLLSSMPMCFNLFGALGAAPRFVDLMRAVFDSDTAVIDDAICEAPSPSTWPDRTAFDAQIDYRARSGERRFVAIETKYTEPFSPQCYDRADYRHLTDASGWFLVGAANELAGPATNQLWRGLLLAFVVESETGAVGRYAVVAPADDRAAIDAVARVRSQLVGPTPRLRLVTLDEIVAAARSMGDRHLDVWAERFAARYLPARPRHSSVDQV